MWHRQNEFENNLEKYLMIEMKAVLILLSVHYCVLFPDNETCLIDSTGN